MTMLRSVAGVTLHDDEDFMALVHTICADTIPIMRPDGTSYVPAEDMIGALAEQLGLSRDTLTDDQKAELDSFAFWAKTNFC